MKKEKFSNFLKDGIEMLNQGEDMNKVKDFLENVIEKVKKTELSDELKEDLAYYKKLNEKFKDNEDIDLKKVEKNIKEYQEERLGQLLDKTVVFGEKFRIDTTELNDDVFDETSEEYDMDFKYTTLNEFLGDDDSLLYKRYDLPSEVHSKKEEEDRDYQLYKEIIMEAKAYGNVIKERFQNITDENGYIEKEDLKELCEDFNFNAEDKFIELNDDIEKSPKEKLEYEKKDLENKTETFDFMNKHTKFKEDEEKFKKSVKEYQKDFLDYVIKTELNETSPNEYRFKNNDFLEKNKDWKELVERFREVEKVNPIKDNIDKNSLYERYNIKGEDRLYQSILENKGIGKEIDFYEERVRLDLKDRTVGKGKDFLEVKELVHLYNSYEMPEKLSFALGLIDVRKDMKERELNEEKSDNPEINKNSEINKFEYSDELVDIFNGVDIFKDKEIKNIEAEEKTPKKEYTNNNELKEEIRSYQQDIIEAVVENEFEKISKNEYKLKDNTLLDKENWEKELKTDKYKDYNAFNIFDNTMTRTEMVERYDLDKKLSPFEIYTNDGDLLYNSASENNDFDKIREYAKENLANYDFEEFINEDLTKFENWQKVTTYDVGIGITELNGEKKQIYDVYDYTDPVYKELCQEIDKERVNFEEEIRLSFKEHIDNNIIKSDDLLKVFKKFDNGNDKRLERFEEKINDTEISTKEVEEKLKDREKDF